MPRRRAHRTPSVASTWRRRVHAKAERATSVAAAENNVRANSYDELLHSKKFRRPAFRQRRGPAFQPQKIRPENLMPKLIDPEEQRSLSRPTTSLPSSSLATIRRQHLAQGNRRSSTAQPATRSTYFPLLRTAAHSRSSSISSRRSQDNQSSNADPDDDEYLDWTSPLPVDEESHDSQAKVKSHLMGTEPFSILGLTSEMDLDVMNELRAMPRNDEPVREVDLKKMDHIGRQAAQQARDSERAFRYVKKRIMASAYKMGEMDFWARFKAADTDGNGVLDRDEFTRMCRLQIPGITDDGIDMVIDQIDVDKSGTIDYAEFLRFLVEEVRIDIAVPESQQIRKLEPSKVLKATPGLLHENPHLVKRRGQQNFHSVVYEEQTASALSEAITHRRLHDVSKRQMRFQIWMSYNTPPELRSS